jgi:hypothetical protein
MHIPKAEGDHQIAHLSAHIRTGHQPICRGQHAGAGRRDALRIAVKMAQKGTLKFPPLQPHANLRFRPTLARCKPAPYQWRWIRKVNRPHHDAHGQQTQDHDLQNKYHHLNVYPDECLIQAAETNPAIAPRTGFAPFGNSRQATACGAQVERYLHQTPSTFQLLRTTAIHGYSSYELANARTKAFYWRTFGTDAGVF